MSGRKTILIIEDDVCLTEMLQVHIEAKRNRYKVIIANDGEDGLKKAQTKNPDLIVLDIGLPKMGGIEVYKQLPKDNGKTNVPVLVFTARGELEDFFEQIDVEGFISKPFETEELLGEIDRIIDKKEKPAVYVIDEQINPHVKEIEKAVKRLGFKVVLVDNMEFFKVAVKKTPPSIVLLEYEQSDIDGAEAIKQIKSSTSNKAIKIGVYTYSEGKYKVDSLDAGADAYIGKPASVIDVINAVKSMKDSLAKDVEVKGLLDKRSNPEDEQPDLNSLF